MKTILVAVDFPPVISGIGTVFYNIWRKLPDSKYSIIAPLSKGCRDFDKKENYKIHRVFIPLGNSIFARLLRTKLLFFYLIYFIVMEKINLIICGSPISSGLAGLIIKKMFGIPYMVFVYGGETKYYAKHKTIRWILKKVVNNAKLVIANSNYTKSEFGNIVKSKNIRIITPGVDTSLFVPSEKNKSLMERYNLKNKKVLLTVARLTKRKGHENVIKSMPEIIKLFPDLVYIIVGKGPEEQSLRTLVNELHLENNVIFCGYVKNEDVPLYYNLCDIFIMLSKEIQGDWHDEPIEGFGTSFLEASACAKPVIAGKSGGTEDAVDEGKSGYLVDPENYEQIKNAFLKILSDEKYAKEMGLNGREFAASNYDWNIIITMFCDIINEIKDNHEL